MTHRKNERVWIQCFQTDEINAQYTHFSNDGIIPLGWTKISGGVGSRLIIKNIWIGTRIGCFRGYKDVNP